MAKSLQAGKLIIGAIAVSVDPTGTAFTTLGIDSALQIKDWLKKTPDLAKLSAELDKAFTVEIAKASYDKPNGIRTLLPQMLEAGQPNGDDIAYHTLDATLIFDTMQSKLTDPEHRRPENLTAVRRAILPLLAQACNDTRLEQALRPSLTRAQGAAQREQTSILSKIHTAVTADDTDETRTLLQNLAARLNVENAFDLSYTQLRKELSDKADQHRALIKELEALKGISARIDNIHGAALDAAERGNYSEANQLLENAREINLTENVLPALETNAKLLKTRADIALLNGEINEAFRILSTAADSFAAVDPTAPARKRLEYADILYNHGLRYGSTGMTYAAAMIRDAIALLDRDTQSALWGGAQNNLAIALQNHGTRTQGAEGAALLVNAVTACRNALEVITRANHPVNWATTKNNLAIALQEQGIRTQGAEGADLLAQAVTAYRAALEVRTRADHPVHWARTQNNLAGTLQLQGNLTKGAGGAVLLVQAVTACRNALEVTTCADHPVDWAMTQDNIARCEASRAEHDSCHDPRPPLTAALEAVNNALTVYDPEHMSYYHAKATRLRDRIQAKLDALPPE
jgi:hypothetical protein